MKKLTLFALALPLLAFACSGDKADPIVDETPADPAATETPTAMAVELDAKCGCSIEEIGACGNYAMVDGKWTEITYPAFGSMEWCGDKDAGAKIKVTGEMVDGKYVAATYERVN